MTKPITPEEAAVKSRVAVPEAVVRAFNDQIVLNWYNGKAEVLQKDVVALARVEGEAWSDAWLNIESLYEGYGWEVEYDKPGYNETYDAKFTFRQKG